MKKLDEPQSTPSDSLSHLEADKVRGLIAAVAKVADARLDLSECRTEILTRLLEMVESAGGMWAWGVTDEATKSIVLVATIEVGLNASEKTALINLALDPSMHEEFRVPIRKRIQGQSQGTSQGQSQDMAQLTLLRTDLFTADQWKSTKMYANRPAGFDEWLHSVRFVRTETWSSLHLLRRTGEPPFLPADQQLIDLAMSSIPWLEATLDNSLPVESSVALTARQRIVLMMQLDGLSRKDIAERLQISVDTIGDHMKKIHEHFDVTSTGELAALFLRNR